MRGGVFYFLKRIVKAETYVCGDYGKEEQIMRPMILIVIIAAAMLSGCATTYQKQSFTGGYSETQLGENIFQVSFKGNRYTSRERVSDFPSFVPQRSPSRTDSIFVVVDSEKYSKIGTLTTPTISQTTGSAYVSGNYVQGSATTTTFCGQTHIIS